MLEFTTEGLNMPSDEEELFYGHTRLVEKVSCERPCGPAVHLATGLCFLHKKSQLLPYVTANFAVLCCSTFSWSIKASKPSCLPDFVLLPSVNKLQPKKGLRLHLKLPESQQ